MAKKKDEKSKKRGKDDKKAAKGGKKKVVKSDKKPKGGMKVAESAPTVPAAVVPADLRAALRVEPGFDLAAVDPQSTPAYAGDKASAQAEMVAAAAEITELQERLWADGRDNEGPAVLLVLQGMDTSGKGGIVRHVVGSVDPQGVQLASFKAPTAQEKRHPFLWRIRNALPEPGMIGVFDRSHYEDVLIARVRSLAPVSTIKGRYRQINTFEQSARQKKDIRLIKVMLHISPDEQKARLMERLERPDKQWKYNPGDVDERELWGAYQESYQIMLDKTATDEAPWYVVPADRKWYARLAVQQLLLAELRDIDPQWPRPTYDVDVEVGRLSAT